MRERYGDDPPEAVAAVLTRLEQLHASESEENPHDRAGKLLRSRTPAFLFFADSHRALQTNYEWTDYEEPPTALANLCYLAGVDYAQYREIAMDRDRRDELWPCPASVDTSRLALKSLPLLG